MSRCGIGRPGARAHHCCRLLYTHAESLVNFCHARAPTEREVPRSVVLSCCLRTLSLRSSTIVRRGENRDIRNPAVDLHSGAALAYGQDLGAGGAGAVDTLVGNALLFFNCLATALYVICVKLALARGYPKRRHESVPTHEFELWYADFLNSRA